MASEGGGGGNWRRRRRLLEEEEETGSSSASSTPAADPTFACCIPDAALSVRQERSSSHGEEEWENLLSEDTAQLEFLSLTKNASESPLIERNVYKQRGRGAFTHGEMGMHIDRVAKCLPEERKETNTKREEGEPEEAFSNAQPKGIAVTYGVRHVLVVSFSPSVTTRDLEELFERFGSDGVVIRWVNDTTALAVFRNPETAKDALQSTRSPHFRLKLLADEDLLLDLVKEKDLQPPVPRPATSARAAHRMIMGALQRQGGRNEAPWTSKSKSSQQQEFERRQRLQTRQKLREEAWGIEDSNQ